MRLKSSCGQQDHIPSGFSRGGSFLCPFQIQEFSLKSFFVIKVLVYQSRPTLCDPMESSVHGISQARILEWLAIPFSRGSSQHRD